jgi:hypothetical protein
MFKFYQRSDTETCGAGRTVYTREFHPTTTFGKRPQPLFWGGSPTALVTKQMSGTRNLLNNSTKLTL